MHQTTIFNSKGWDELTDIFGVHPLGLYLNDIELLKTIDSFGPISASNLAIKLGVNINNIENELEIRLRELGLIQSSPRGRMLTEKGEEYLMEKGDN